jgi:hypothetical protein
MALKEPITEKWNRWFDAIRKDLVDLHYYRMIYREVCAMVDANPAIQKPSSFYVFLRSGYVTLAFIIIRRQVTGDKYSVTEDKYSVSLARLLSEISTHPQEISRQRFHGLYAGLGRSETRIDKLFEAAGVGAGRDFIDPDMVKSDLAMLKDVTKALHKYTDKTVAHIDVNGWTSTIPTFGDLDDAIDTLARVCGKYSILLRAEEIPSFEPIISPTWKAVFRVPWIVDEPGGQAQRREPHVS